MLFFYQEIFITLNPIAIRIQGYGSPYSSFKVLGVVCGSNTEKCFDRTSIARGELFLNSEDF